MCRCYARGMVDISAFWAGLAGLDGEPSLLEAFVDLVLERLD